MTEKTTITVWRGRFISFGVDIRNSMDLCKYFDYDMGVKKNDKR